MVFSHVKLSVVKSEIVNRTVFMGVPLVQKRTKMHPLTWRSKRDFVRSDVSRKPVRSDVNAVVLHLRQTSDDVRKGGLVSNKGPRDVAADADGYNEVADDGEVLLVKCPGNVGGVGFNVGHTQHRFGGSP